MIDLAAAEMLGQGHERWCFRHPWMADRVIKVLRPDCQQNRQQNRIDQYYLASLERRGVPADHVPRQYGMVETSFGPGLVLDLIVDASGRAARSIGILLRSGEVSTADARRMLAELYLHLWIHGIVMVDISLGNLVCRRNGSDWQAVVIDGFGSRYFDIKLWLRARYPRLARLKLKAQWPEWEHQFRKAGLLTTGG